MTEESKPPFEFRRGFIEGLKQAKFLVGKVGSHRAAKGVIDFEIAWCEREHRQAVLQLLDGLETERGESATATKGR